MGFVVPSSKLKIFKGPSFCKVFPPPLASPLPSPHIYILVLGLTQFLQEFFFHLSELDTNRHFSYELLAAFLGNLLAVPQVNVTDIPTAFEERQALVSYLIAVWREEDTGEVEEAWNRGPPPLSP